MDDKIPGGSPLTVIFNVPVHVVVKSMVVVTIAVLWLTVWVKAPTVTEELILQVGQVPHKGLFSLVRAEFKLKFSGSLEIFDTHQPDKS